MRQRLIMTAAVLMLLGVMPTTAAGQTGNELIEYCPDFLSEDLAVRATFTGGYCSGIVRGVSHSIHAYENPEGILDLLNEVYTPRYCPQRGVTFLQEVRVVIKYLEDHPEELHRADHQLVAAALFEAFPCPD